MRRPLAFFRLTISLFLLTPLAALHAQLDLPELPENQNFVQDYAGILPPDTEQAIGQRQREAFGEYDTPIVVVTIESMAQYGGAGFSIERFAHAWFNRWQIGKRGEAGELINQGILLLISRDDREARIELGGDWGSRWDQHCARIMQDRIIARFKQGDFAEGTLAGVEALVEMAALGPQAEPPKSLMDHLPADLDEKPLATSPLPLWGICLAVVAGLACFGLAFKMPQHRKTLIIAGLVLIGGAFLFWILLGIFAIFGRGNGGGSGGFSGGGFSSGGFSGGGGASGSW